MSKGKGGAEVCITMCLKFGRGNVGIVVVLIELILNVSTEQSDGIKFLKSWF